jgi:hypothetical protein
MGQDLSNTHFGVNSNHEYDIEAYFLAGRITVNRRKTTVGCKLILPEYGDLYVHAEFRHLLLAMKLSKRSLHILSNVTSPKK